MREQESKLISNQRDIIKPVGLLSEGTPNPANDEKVEKLLDWLVSRNFNRTRVKKQIGSKYIYKTNKFNVVSTQPVGRKSIFTIIILLNKILSSQYRNVFLQGLINANKLEHLRILENVVHTYFSYYYMKDIIKIRTMTHYRNILKNLN